MAVEKKSQHEETEEEKNAPVKSDPETLHTTDPQEHMEGPVSSLMKKVGEGFEDEKAEREIKKEEKEKGEK